MLHQIRSEKVDGTAGTSSARDVSTLLDEAASVQEAAATIIAEALTNNFRKLSGIEAKERSVTDRNAIGVDSLLGLELKSWLLRKVYEGLAALEILGNTKLCNVSMLATRKSLLVEAEGKNA
jgi:hypothetical protein